MSSLLWSLVVRPVSTMEPQPTFFCHICLSNVPEAARFRTVVASQQQGQQQGRAGAPGPCEHAFCRDCIQGE